MYITCLDLEGVLVPEIWIAFAEETGIPELKRTTRDEPDYDKLMKYRLNILKEHGLGLKEIQETIAKIDIVTGNGIIVCESPAESVLPEGTAPYEKGREYRYGKIKVSCHGGLTYSEKGIGPLFPDAFWIGWDYAHFGDRIELPSYGRKGKTWTTREILADVENVVYQLSGIGRNGG